MKVFVDLFFKLSSFVLFVNLEIEAFKKHALSYGGCCHYSNTSCPPVTNFEYFDDSLVINTIETNKNTKSFKKRKTASIYRSQISINTTSVPTYKDTMLTSARFARNKTICDTKQTESIIIEEGKKIAIDEHLEILQNEKEWKKNFASIECGAKLIKNSKNLKHPNHIINKNNDEYMLNECKDETYFVIELCETIKLIRLELDNFELYSGTPKNFTVRTVDKYSNNLNDWIIIGTFEASHEKMEVQNFSDLEIKSFGKFIRVDINSFHGIEHFCTLTSFRVFGITEYEYLSHTEFDDDEEEAENITDNHEEIQISSIENKLTELAMKREAHDVLKDQTTMLSYKYIFLQMRSDVCVDKVEFESFTKQGLLRNKENIQSIEYSTIEKKIVDVSQAKITDSSQTIQKKEQNITKSVNVSNTVIVPKESVLVQISNRVKILEKNYTFQNNLMKSFNLSSKQQASDINKILETILKAKEVFQETVGETERVKGKVKDLNKKVTSFEETLGVYAESLKLMMALSVFLSVLCLFLISLICFKPSDRKVEEEVESCEEVEIKTLEADISPNNDVQVQTDSPKTKKKVSFLEKATEITPATSDEDISTKLENYRRAIRKEPRRRVTWCGGTFRKLAEEAKYLVKEM